LQARTPEVAKWSAECQGRGRRRGQSRGSRPAVSSLARWGCGNGSNSSWWSGHSCSLAHCPRRHWSGHPPRAMTFGDTPCVISPRFLSGWICGCARPQHTHPWDGLCNIARISPACIGLWRSVCSLYSLFVTSNHGQMTPLQECTSAVWTLSQNGCGEKERWGCLDCFPLHYNEQAPTVSDSRCWAHRPRRKEQVEWKWSVPSEVWPLTEAGLEKQLGHTIAELWYFGYLVPQLCLTRRRRSLFRVVEDSGFVTLSSLSSFSSLSASGGVTITRHKMDRNEKSDEPVTNWLSDISRRRKKTFLSRCCARALRSAIQLIRTMLNYRTRKVVELGSALKHNR